MDENTEFNQQLSTVPAVDHTANAIVEHEDTENLAASIHERARQRSAAQTNDDVLDTMTLQELYDSVETINADDAPLWQVPVKVCLWFLRLYLY